MVALLIRLVYSLLVSVLLNLLAPILQTPYNPYGQAHMVNHPPRFAEPNVLQLMFDFPGDPWGFDQFPVHLQKYIPNLYAKKPTLIGTPDR